MKAEMIWSVPDTKREEKCHPKGEIKEGPEVWKLVRVGHAKPADDECLIRCEQMVASYNRKRGTNYTLEEYIIHANNIQRRNMAGIHPDDRDHWESGAISGYDAQGNYLPGPNQESYAALTAEVESEGDEVGENNQFGDEDE